jgi:hypothetical protein
MSAALAAGTTSTASTSRDSKTMRVPDKAIVASLQRSFVRRRMQLQAKIVIEKLASYERNLIDDEQLYIYSYSGGFRPGRNANV